MAHHPAAKGHRTAIKPTNKQLEQRIDFCIEMMGSKRLHKSQMKDALLAFLVKQGFPDGVSPRTFESYLARARQLMASTRKADIETQTENALALYNSVIRDATASHRDKIAAQTRIDILLGLEAPRRQDAGTSMATAVAPNGALEALKLVYGGETLKAAG